LTQVRGTTGCRRRSPNGSNATRFPDYLAGLGAGAVAGTAWPGAGWCWEAAIYPVLGTLLCATFLQAFARLIAAFRDVRFLTAVLAINFVVVPVVVAALTLPLTLSRTVLLGVLLTLLTPCIDYVIVFCGLADRLRPAHPVAAARAVLNLPRAHKT
jgi:ACR3 family arsenite transporter